MESETMKNDDEDKKSYQGRSIDVSEVVGSLSKDIDAGLIIQLLRGTWVSRSEGWNLIALPASAKVLKNKPDSDKDIFRLLMNQYGETLKFNMPDTKVPNRGIDANDPDQRVDGITYEQFVVQKAVADFPESIDAVRAKMNEPIHHEPGFILEFRDHVHVGKSPDVVDDNGDMIEKELTIARMGTIPHGNAVLAMGFVDHELTLDEEDDNAFPERLKKGDIDGSDFAPASQLAHYLKPYKHFMNSPFLGCVDTNKNPDFPGFSPDHFHKILKNVRDKLNIKKTTVLNFDTKFKVAGIDDAKFDENDKPIAGFPISNVPFVKREANVTEMHATFWIMELEKTDTCDGSDPEFVMQYSQTVYLEFFDSPVEKDPTTGKPRRIRWPHVSINTLRKVDPLN